MTDSCSEQFSENYANRDNDAPLNSKSTSGLATEKSFDKSTDPRFEAMSSRIRSPVNYSRMTGRTDRKVKRLPYFHSTYHPKTELISKRSSTLVQIRRSTGRDSVILHAPPVRLLSVENNISHDTPTQWLYTENRRPVSPRQYMAIPNFGKMSSRKEFPSVNLSESAHLEYDVSDKLMSPKSPVVDMAKLTSRTTHKISFGAMAPQMRDLSYTPSHRLQETAVPASDLFLYSGRNKDVQQVADSVDLMLMRISGRLRHMGVSTEEELALEQEYDQTQGIHHSLMSTREICRRSSARPSSTRTRTRTNRKRRPVSATVNASTSTVVDQQNRMLMASNESVRIRPSTSIGTSLTRLKPVMSFMAGQK